MEADCERSWVVRACRGDQDAFAKLVEAYKKPVYNLAYRMLGSATEAEDAAQETFLKVYRRLDTFDLDRKFSSWILSIASHHCVDCLRRRRGSAVSMEEIQSWRWISDERPRPEELAVKGERRQAIRQMLDQLPPQYRLVIILRYWHEFSYEEIAQATDSTTSAVKSRLHRARRMMAARVGEEDRAGEPISARAPLKEAENVLSQSF